MVDPASHDPAPAPSTQPLDAIDAESLSLLEAVFECLPAAAGIFDDQGRWTATNRQLRNLLGSGIPSRDPRHAPRWTARNDAGEPLAAADWPGARALRGLSTQPGIDFLHTAPDGGQRWVRVSGAPFQLPGQLPGGMAVLLDIDRESRATALLRLSEERWRGVVQQAVAGIVQADAQGRMTLASRRWCELTGYSEAELLGMSLSDVTHAAHLQQTTDALLQMVAGAREVHLEKRYVRKDGSAFWAKSSVSAIRDTEGRFQGLVAVVIDITDSKRAEEALRDSEQRFRHLFESNPQPMFVLDRESLAFVAVNEAALRLYGEAQGAFLQRDLTDILWPEEISRHRAAVQGPTAMSAIEGLWRHRGRDGGPIDVQVTSRVLQFAGRTAALVLIDDVTAQLHAERRLRQGEATLRSFYDSVPLMMGVVEVGEANDILHVYDNPATEAFFGVGTAGTAGRWASQLGVPDLIRQQWVQAYRTSLREARPVRIESCHAIVTGEAWLATTVAYIGPGELGNPRFSYVTENITEQRRAAQRLREREQQLALALEAGSLGFFDVDMPSGRATYGGCWAPMLGHEPGAVQPTLDAWRQLMHPEDLPRARAALQEHLAGRSEFFECEHRMRHRDGAWRWILGRGTVAERTADGQPLRIIGVTTDVTARRAIEDRLKADDTRKNEFLAMLAHELRNPLAPMRSAVELLRRLGLADSRQHQATDVLDRQVSHMVRLIDDLMDVSRVTHGKVELHLSRLSLQDVIGHAVDAVQPLLAAAEHPLALQLPPGALRVQADAVRLTQVLVNLLSNACKFSPPGSTISLRLEQHASDAVLAVADTGIGIDAQDLGRVFEMFAQMGSSAIRRGGGLGVGLTLSRAIVELHGGRIEARSAGIGRGSTFTVWLPLAADAAARPQASATAAVQALSSARPAGLRRRVLVADDNAEAASVLALLLELLGQEVRVVHDGRAAVEAARLWQPDMALLDIGMPVLNGLDAAREIAASPWGRRIRLVALTGWGQPDDRQRSADAGFVAHLVKPASEAQLRAQLEAL